MIEGYARRKRPDPGLYFVISRPLYYMAILPSAIILTACLVSAIIARQRAHLIFGDVFYTYFYIGISTTILSILVWFFHQIWRCMLKRADNPLTICIRRLKPRLPLLMLPALVSPMFLCGYTTAKIAIPMTVHYNWDAVLAALDRTIFRVDPYVLTHRIIGDNLLPVAASIYSLWGGVLVAVQALLVLYGRGRTISIFYMTMLSAWLVGGVWLAFIFASGGPAFAHLFDPSLKGYFVPLLDHIRPESLAGRTQAYLAGSLGSATVEKGGGISAMPSMHVATVGVYVLAARRTRWLSPAIVFAIVIWILSVHLAFHYAVDGIASFALVLLLWRIASAAYDRLRRHHMSRSSFGIGEEPATAQQCLAVRRAVVRPERGGGRWRSPGWRAADRVARSRR